MTTAMALLTACGTLIDTPNQQVQIITTGATAAKCTLKNEFVKYVVYPPQTVLIRRAQEPLTVTCEAPGNRSKTIVIHSRMNGDSMGNALNAGLGVAVDQISGGLYEYPNLVDVDFTQTRALGQGMPLYHAVDTVSPFDQTPEDLENHEILVPAPKSVPVPYKPKEDKTDSSIKSDTGGGETTGSKSDTPLDKTTISVSEKAPEKTDSETVTESASSPEKKEASKEKQGGTVPAEKKKSSVLEKTTPPKAPLEDSEEENTPSKFISGGKI